MRVAINGFGRIGKLVFRAFLEKNLKGIDIVAINELGSLDSSLHLMQYDSVHGKLPIQINKTKDGLKYKNKTIKFFSERDPLNLPWKKLNVDIVLECSGVFASKEKASAASVIAFIYKADRGEGENLGLMLKQMWLFLVGLATIQNVGDKSL